MTDYNWSTFTTRIPISADPQKLYDAWSTRQGIEHWFLRFSEYRRPDGFLRDDTEAVMPGDTYQWLWHGWVDEVAEHGTILDCNGKDFFKFTFGDAGICSVSIKEEFGETIVELVQSEIPSDDRGKHYWHLGCKTGWTFYLTNMKSIFEGGVDLRNRNIDLKNVINS